MDSTRYIYGIKGSVSLGAKERPHNVHLAPEYEYRAKHLMKAHKN